MDVQTVWLVILSIAAPVAGVVGFAIQLRQVKAARLENAKLQLEIDELRRRASAESAGIAIATPAEIRRLREGDAVFRLHPREGDPELELLSFRKSLKERLGEGVLLAVLLLVFCYAVYDLYRLVRWIAG